MIVKVVFSQKGNNEDTVGANGACFVDLDEHRRTIKIGCCNAKCVGGGYDIGWIARSGNREGTVSCCGSERGKRCLNYLRYMVEPVGQNTEQNGS